MADGKKGKSSQGGATQAAAIEAETLEETESELEAAKEAAVEVEQKAHPPHGAGGHSHKPNVKEYLVIFAVLAGLTLLEVVVAQTPGISRKLIGVALVGLALTKAAIVGLYYMHLKHETRFLKLTVAIPIAAPTIYALVLISEAAWRLTRW
jgi:cytochrome c oxidase subunit 4